MKNKVKKLMVAAMLLVLIFCTGCSRISKQKAIELIEKDLHDTYGGTFKVVAIESKTSDGNGVPFAGVSYLKAVVTELNSGEFFEAQCNAETGTVTDNYGKRVGYEP